MDKEAVGMEKDAMESAVRQAGGIVHRDGNIFFTGYRQMKAAMALAQQPAAQAAGLTDEQFIAAHGERLAAMLGIKEWWDIADRDARIKAALLSRAAPSGEAVAYVECRECCRCGHTGINDAHAQDACCSNCDWTGPSPKEDVCPGCAQTGTMRAACPKCSSVYRLLCDANIAAPQPSEQQAGCTCPSGDGSLRWPCSQHRAEQPAATCDHEQIRMEGFRDGFKAAQAIEEALGVIPRHVLEAVQRYGDARVDNGNSGKALVEVIHHIRALLAAPAAAEAQEPSETGGAGVSADYQRGYEDGQADAQSRQAQGTPEWFALVMGAAASLEDAANSIREPDAQRVAASAAQHYRDKANELSSRQAQGGAQVNAIITKHFRDDPANAARAYAAVTEILGSQPQGGALSNEDIEREWDRAWKEVEPPIGIRKVVCATVRACLARAASKHEEC